MKLPVLSMINRMTSPVSSREPSKGSRNLRAAWLLAPLLLLGGCATTGGGGGEGAEGVSASAFTDPLPRSGAA